MAQAFTHAGGCGILPDIVVLHTDSRDGDLADGPVGEQTDLIQIRKPCHSRQQCIASHIGNSGEYLGDITGGYASGNPITTTAGAGVDALLQARQQGFFHNPGLGSAEGTVLQLRDLIVHQIGAAVIVAGPVDLLIGGGVIVFRCAVCGKGIVGRLSADRQGKQRCC